MSKKVKSVQRKFNVTPSIMLTAAKTAGMNLEANITMFENYPHLTKEWLRILYGDIDAAGKKVGVKANEPQRAATAAITSIQTNAVDTALTIKNQAERGYLKEKTRLNEVMDLLGYNKNWTKANNHNQNALLELLLAFDNHADNLYEELTAHKVAAGLIDKMKAFAQMMTDANVTQESLKSIAPTITVEMTEKLNDIYNRVMDICSAGKIVFRNDPVKRELFTFKQLTTRQTAATKTKPVDNNDKTEQ